MFVDFFGYVGPKLAAGVNKVPPTIIFHNKNDLVVTVAEHSEPFAKALSAAGKVYEPVPPYNWYDEHWLEVDHAFEPDQHADKDSRVRTAKWVQKHLPPVGR